MSSEGMKVPIKRWTPADGDDGAEMWKHPDGEYVRFDEYAAVIAERDRMRDALSALVEALTAVEPHINSAFVFQAIHGANYKGPTYGVQLEAARAALSEGPKEGR